MTKLVISAKDLDQGLNYKPFHPIQFNNKVFIQQNLKQEVRRKNIGKLNKVGILPLMLGTMLIPEMVLAAPVTDTNILFDPNKIMDYGLAIAVATVAIGAGASMVFLSLAGIMRMLRKKQFAKEWRSDIISGFIQVMIAIPVTFSIWYLGTILFGNLGHLEGLF
ncbi:hypothetical protein [Aquibacillus saliphilus]|uniref:hypothetical protein n=1 Tax=Aquibacillus saliphilus TaxID=1909422 RepID=UPI001CEFC9AE|nr:hypothetical protein [Aquibacillus saliphilus]